MTDKLTDNEIIKALECCYTTENPWENPCKNCPLCDVEECNDVLMAEYVKDLINRLQSQNKDLAETVHNLTIEKDALFDKSEELKAEVERLKECPKCAYEYDGKMTEYCVQGPCQNFKTVEQVNVEAYKECIAKVRKLAVGMYPCFDEIRIFDSDLDNLLKELVGE